MSDDKQQPATPRTDALAAKSEYQGAYLHLCRQLERELALAKSAGLRGEQASYRIGYVDGATGKPPQVELTGPEKALCTPSHVLRSEPTEAMIDAAWAELQQWAAAAGEWQREQAACIMRAALGCAERQFDKRHPVSASDFRLLTESQKYGLYAECFRSAEGSTDIKLSDRIRPNSEAAPWVIEEIRKLERRCAKSHVVTSPPAGYTLVESELFNEICRALTPEQQRGICIAEGERWMRSTDRGNDAPSDTGEIGT